MEGIETIDHSVTFQDEELEPAREIHKGSSFVVS